MWTKEQFQAWAHSPETTEFKAFLRERRDVLKERWADGQEMTAHERAMAQVFGDLLNLTYEQDVEPYYEKETKESDEPSE